MGIYLLSIAVADAWFGSDYFTVYSEAWQTGAVCGMIGIIGTLSIIGSLFTLTAMSIDRLVWIVLPKGKTCFNRIWADTVCAIIWVSGTLLAILPLLLSQKFEDFYEHSDACLNLPIVAVSEPVARGFDWQNQLYLLSGYTAFMEGVVWTYSLVIYTCLSSVCILIATLCYTIVLTSELLLKENVLPKDWRNPDFQLAMKMSIIVGVNVLCWFCVIILTVLSQLNIITPNMVNPLLVILFLPLKSALNPLVYCYGNILKCPKPRMVLKISLVRQRNHSSANLTSPGVDPMTK
ncbi:hypothetical protein HOLleu_34043 [Holothuria leucospilota]|uniref:G-protein coupled receptors family 1 profile domain-containing protein n=1 Tax=Holothuria leucospilota TaxID=206669 RepID=A0A9Q0YRS1_HOLLE|nr:hypothetical protein HOLleu_34043 [Holothuria leucospilota]